MTKKKILVITVAAVIVIAGTLALIFLQMKPKEPPIEPVNVSSQESSSNVSSEFVVPDIVPPDPIVTSKAESKTEDLTVKGSPDGTSSVPTVQAPPTSSVTEKPKPTAKPTGDGDVYDVETDTYPKLGDTRVDPITGYNMVWIGTDAPSVISGWAATDVPSQPDVAADTKPDDWYLGNPDYDIGAE